MCVICVKPMNIGFPSWDMLERCFDANPDGAGYMLATGGKVLIRKGFMTFRHFRDSLYEDRAIHGDKPCYVMHFRISTQAGVTPWGCHPYPVTRDIDDMKQLSCECKVGLAHNGILASYSDKSKSYNDSMLFCSKFLSRVVNGNQKWYKNKKAVSDVSLESSGSRLAILSSNGHCEMTGNWIQEGGVYYSNFSYMESKIFSTGCYGGSWDFYSGTGYEDKEYLDDSYWETFYDYGTDLFDFDIGDCPMYIDGDDSYCHYCKNNMACINIIADKEKKA